MKKVNLNEAKELLKEMGYELCTTFYDAFEVRYDVKEDIENECEYMGYDEELTKKIIDKYLSTTDYLDTLENSYDDAMEYCSPYRDCIIELIEEIVDDLTFDKMREDM